MRGDGMSASPDNILKLKAGISAGEVTARIIDYWDRATERNREDGAQWYLIQQQAIDDMAADAGLSSETVAAVVAHLSPRIHWSRNLVSAEILLKGSKPPGIMSRSLLGAKSALDSDDPVSTLKGPKTHSFALNLLGDSDAVTIDVWALRVALGSKADELVLNRVGVYDAISHCYRDAARMAGVSPSTMQATVWIVARNGRAS
jgi:hypothetical protein